MTTGKITALHDAQLDREIMQARADLLAQIQFLQKQLGDAVFALDSGENPTELGIVQGQGSKIDIAAARLSSLTKIRAYWSKE